MAGKAMQLERLVKALGRDDLASVDALLMDVTGERETAAMLGYLLACWPGEADAQGWVARSHAEWWAALRIQRNHLPRLNGMLELAGVEIRVKKRNGAPVKHYRLKTGDFAEVVARRLGLSVEQAAMLDSDCTPGAAIGQSGNPVVVSFIQRLYQRTLELIRTTTTHFQKFREIGKRQADERAVQMAMALPEMAEQTARRLVARYGPQQVKAVVGYAATYAGQLSNPVGFVVAKLKEGWSPPEQAEPLAHLRDGKRYTSGKYADFIVH